MIQGNQSHLSFSIARSQLRNRVLIPKYYDPEITFANERAISDFELPELKQLLLPGSLGSRLGSWIRREHYGTGTIPYVRTSDFNGWRLRPDYKKGVSRAVFDSVAARQDVKPGDILMVAHGTYLVGSVAMVTEDDLPLVLQDHVFRLRIAPKHAFMGSTSPDRWLLLAALSTRFVRRQIRARQFSADIIDKIGDRHLEVRVPIPRDPDRRKHLSEAVREIIEGQTEVRTKLSSLLTSDMRMTRERSVARHGFSIPRSSVVRRILIPKYYDPTLNEDLAASVKQSGSPWVSIASLVAAGRIEVTTGVEVGKMAYGTGSIPFLRTTDIAELEVKADPRQGISREIFDKFAGKASLVENDVLLIRDGTYLVGSSAIVTSRDTPALISGGIYRLRATYAESVNLFTLLALLNLPVVRRQMRSKQFTRDVIDTLGKRLFEVQLPDPDSPWARHLGTELAALMLRKSRLRASMTAAIALDEPSIPPQLQTRPGWSMRG